MEVKITPVSGTEQILEFNVSLPCGANAAIAPVSTLTATQRWAAMAENNGQFTQITKIDLVHTTQYTDCKGNVRIVTNGISIVTQDTLSQLPTTLPVKGNCAYSVFEIQIPTTTTPT